jgi:FkbM family methyltransferase
MSFISYAQNFEDVMLWRALKHVECGFYVDVGANDPEIDSVTKAFYDFGWRGINIEPVPQWFDRLQEKRLRDINLQLAAGAEKGELVLYELPDTGLSTIKKTTAVRHEAEHGYTKFERTVLVETLTSICQRFHVAPIHFLKIDVEGAEKDVLDGLDLSVIRPWIILVESTMPYTQIENYAQWDPIILAANYDYVYFDGLNRFYVAQEHEDLKAHFNAPPNVFDGFMLSGLASQPFYKLVEAKVQEGQQRTLAAESRAQEQEQRAVAAEGRAQEQEQRAVAAEGRAQEQEQRAVAAEGRAQEQERRAVAAEGRAQEQERRAVAAESRAQEQQKHIDELGGSAHHWWLQACALETERNALRQSWSWRITAPVRWVGGLAIGGFSALRYGANHFAHVSINALRRPIAMTMRAVLRRPGLSYQINQRLMRHPALHQQLVDIARRAGLIPGMSAYATPSPQQPTMKTASPDLPYLTPRARQIYADLKAAIEQRQKENG